MLSEKVDTLLSFRSPTSELLQQRQANHLAKKYFDFYSFTDNALIFLKRYLTENFDFLKHFDKCTTMMNQGGYKFSSAWAKLEKDPSPLISALMIQTENILSLTSSLPPLEFKAEEEVREEFSKKILSMKTIQAAIDKKFQELWKQSNTQTSQYYTKLEEFKEQSNKVRKKYEKYDKQTRDLKAYNVTWLKKLESKLSERALELKKKKGELEKTSTQVQEAYKNIITFFESNKTQIEEFLRTFLSCLVEMTIFIVERAQENFGYLKQATCEALQKLSKVDILGSWEAESEYIRSLLTSDASHLVFIKEMNRINHLRHEFLSSYGLLSQDTMHICSDFIEKFMYFEERTAFESFISQFDNKATSILHPFADFIMDLKRIFLSFFSLEKIDSEEIIRKLALQRSGAYSSLISAVSKSLNEPGILSPISHCSDSFVSSPRLSHRSKMVVIEKEVTAFLKIEEQLARDFIKDLERLFGGINHVIWNKAIQACQKTLAALQGKVQQDQLQIEVLRIESNLTNDHDTDTHSLSSTTVAPKNENRSPRSAFLTPEDFGMAVDEGYEPKSAEMDKYSHGDFKFLKEKKAEILADFVKKQNEEKLKGLSPLRETKNEDNESYNFPVEKDEKVIASFACAYVDSILLQGRMYMTTKKVAFKSYFNAQTLFGSTVLSIPLEDIYYVSKKKNTFGLENMIEITTKKGQLTFTSFIARDKAFSIIDQLVSTVNMGQSRTSRERRSARSPSEDIFDFDMSDGVPHTGSLSDQKETKESRRLKKLQRREMEFQLRNKAVQKAMPPLEKYEHLGYQESYDIDYNAFYHVVLGHNPITYKGKEYVNFWQLYESEIGAYNVNVSKWDLDEPKHVSVKKHLLKHRKGAERQSQASKDLGVSLPMMPKSLTYKQFQSLYFINETQMALILNVEVQEKLPMIDTFKPMTCFIFKDSGKAHGKDQVTVEFRYYFLWLKDTMLKKMLQKSATQEILSAGPVFQRLIKELVETGVFEKKKKEMEEKHNNQDSDEEEELDEDEPDSRGENAILEEILENEFQQESEQAQSVLHQEIAKNTGQEMVEFRVSKRLLLMYFTVSLFLFSFLLLKIA